MTIRTRLLLSAAWFAVVLGLAIGVLIWIASSSVSERLADARAEALGRATGMLVVFGWGALWLPVAADYGRRKRAERQRVREDRTIVDSRRD